MLTTIVTGVVTALVVTALVGFTRLRWLYLSVPKLSFYSRFSNNGQVVSMTIINNSFRPEEQVEVHLRPQAKYEVLASSQNDVRFDADTTKLVVPRVPRFVRVTVLLLVEGGVWDKSWITSVTSKDTTGRVVENAEQKGTPAQIALALAGLLLITGLFAQYGSLLGRETQRSLWDNVSGYVAPSIDIKPRAATWKGTLSGEFGKKYSMQSLPIVIESIRRSGDTVTVTFVAANELPQAYELSAEIKSSAEGSSGLFSERYVSNVFVVSGDSKRRSLSAVAPDDGKAKLIVVEYRIEYQSDYVRFSYEVTL